MAKKNNKFWLLGIGAALWLLFGRTANSVVNLGFKLVGIYPAEYTKENTKFNLQIAIKNPTNYTLTLWKIKFNLSFNGKQIATIEQNINRKIKSKDVTILNILTNIENNTLVDELRNQLNSGTFDNWTIGMSGNIEVDDSYYPFSAVFFAEDLVPQLQ